MTQDEFPVDNFSYDPSTGIITRLMSIQPRFIGQRADFPDSRSYHRVKAGKRDYVLAHRLAWRLYHGEWPAGLIDHVNGDPTDNRIVNLREATASQNNMNRGPTRDILKGTCFCRASGKYKARIGKDHKKYNLGKFDTREEAHEAYKAAALKMFGEFARV